MKLRVVVMDSEAAAVTATERSTAKEKLCEYTLHDSVCLWIL
jgi:hypothetical protein